MLFQNRYNQALKFLNLIVPKKPSLHALSCIKVTQKKDSVAYEATDLDTFLRIFLPVWGACEGEFLVDAKMFSKTENKIATKITENEVEFGNVTMKNFDIKEFPSLQTMFFKDPVFETYSVKKSEFVEPGIRASTYAALNDLSRGVLQCVCFQNGFFIATNGNFLYRESAGVESEKKYQFVIPPSFFKYLNSDFVFDPYLDISVYRQDEDISYIMAQGRGFELVSKLMPGEYPDIEKVLPKEMPYSFTFNREEFLSAAKKALSFSEASKSKLVFLSPERDMMTIQNVPVDETMPKFRDSFSYTPGSDMKWDGVSFNAKMLVTILEDAGGKTIRMCACENPLSPVTFHPENKSLFFLLMPLRKIEDADTTVDETDTDNEEPVSKPETDSDKKDKSAESNNQNETEKNKPDLKKEKNTRKK